MSEVRRLPVAGVGDTAKAAAALGLPGVGTGVIKRRPAAMALAQRVDADRRGISLLTGLRQRYGPGPLRLRVPGRSVALPLDESQVHRLLEETPEPFSPATTEKRGALGHFQPHGVLITDPAERPGRRAFVEGVLDTGMPLHGDAPAITSVVREEAASLTALAERTGELDWEAFNDAWWRAVRGIVLGGVARGDRRLTELLDRLRMAANWAYLLPSNGSVRERFDARLRAHVDAAEPGSLAARGVDDREQFERQAPHWLFAFDAAGMTVMRTLAVLATHPRAERAAVEEAAGATSPVALLPHLRGCVLDTNRLWPTTPLLLRESTTETRWGTAWLPAGTTFLIHTPYFHRDGATVPDAERFAPQRWQDGSRAGRHPGVVPFSDGPAGCPGQDLVLLAASTMLAELLTRHDYRLCDGPKLSENEPLPATVDNFGMRFAVSRRR